MFQRVRRSNRWRAVWLSTAAIVCGFLLTGCSMRSYADRGTTYGTLTGAAVGAAIGDHNDEPLLGTAVGALAGAVAGNAIGTGIDADVQQASYEQQQNSHAAMQSMMDQVTSMSQQGVGEEVIANHVRAVGLPRPPTAAEIVQMKQRGVSDTVISAMQTSTLAPIRSGGPVIVEEVHHWGPPYSGWHRPYGYGYGYCPPPRRSGFSWGVSVRN